MRGYRDVIDFMLTNKVGNYIVPGLESYLLGAGKIRMFKSTRDRAGFVTPHTHRFDFACYVVRGQVINRLYEPVSPFTNEESAVWTDADEFTIRTIRRDINEAFGDYDDRIVRDEQAHYTSRTNAYRDGDWYAMSWDQFHSIEFSKHTEVIFFEGPEVNTHSKVLLPYVDGETLETMTTEDWMFVEEDSEGEE